MAERLFHPDGPEDAIPMVRAVDVVPGGQWTTSSEVEHLYRAGGDLYGQNSDSPLCSSFLALANPKAAMASTSARRSHIIDTDADDDPVSSLSRRLRATPQ
jgi:hypothetical protein